VAQVGPRGGQGIWFLMVTGSMGLGTLPKAAGPPVRRSAFIFPGSACMWHRLAPGAARPSGFIWLQAPWGRVPCQRLRGRP
jgi:hypothetical protein